MDPERAIDLRRLHSDPLAVVRLWLAPLGMSVALLEHPYHSHHRCSPSGNVGQWQLRTFALTSSIPLREQVSWKRHRHLNLSATRATEGMDFGAGLAAASGLSPHPKGNADEQLGRHSGRSSPAERGCGNTPRYPDEGHRS